MAKYDEIAKRMEEGTIVKAVIGPYIIYRKDWLQENIEQEYILQKSVKDFQPIKDGISRLREFMKAKELEKTAEKQGF